MKIEIKPSALLFIALMTVFFHGWLGWWEGLLAALLLSGCVLAHEFGHAAAARCFGVAVKKIGFGVEAGYNVRERASTRGAEAVIVAAGLAMNLFLFGAFLGVFLVWGNRLAKWVGFCNLVLVASNLVPFGPTDGRRLLRLALNKRQKGVETVGRARHLV